MRLHRPSLLLLAALPLCAQDATFGLKVHGLFPMSDLRDLTNGQLGLGGHLFVEIPVGEGLLFRPTVGGQHIPRGNTLGLAGTKTSVSSLDFMVDVLWFPNDDAKRGPYLVGSLGGHQWRVSATGTSPSATSATRIGLAGGVGYQISAHLGLEAKGFWSPIEKNLTATGLILGATWRF
ncbi:MAG: hypothetical protein IPP58_01965 [Holophagaceae bacterium]|uniref:Outer membrane protein beta-barrel domain-containing protein n=1 Tax=Candidatus Geothrix skivensis TaxID=2954439 RepID=A0A9D7SCX5_9BACT|nr:hypothetical protein [Candidatus Geothrix skivensis]